MLDAHPPCYPCAGVEALRWVGTAWVWAFCTGCLGATKNVLKITDWHWFNANSKWKEQFTEQTIMLWSLCLWMSSPFSCMHLQLPFVGKHVSCKICSWWNLFSRIIFCISWKRLNHCTSANFALTFCGFRVLPVQLDFQWSEDIFLPSATNPFIFHTRSFRWEGFPWVCARSVLTLAFTVVS